MNLFKHKSSDKKGVADPAAMAEMALKSIHDGVIITDKNGVIKFINPAAATMTGYGSPDKAVGLDFGLVIKLQSKEGQDLTDAENPLTQALQSGQALEAFHGNILIGQTGKIVPVSISMLPPEGSAQNRIITFRDITKELTEEGEQAEFISTASHEMRTPVATIDGYVSLALNPQTATIDERARGYLESAQKASKHLGKLFRDLLDVTKLDDGRIKPHPQPVEMVSLVEEITNNFVSRAKEGKVELRFGASKIRGIGFGENRRLGQVVYAYVDPDFIHEIMDNLIENAIKYTPDGGSIYVNVRGDGNRVLINVTDSGIGISSDDLSHIFQKFYRADNSDTRTIGGTGLGLYLVKQRVEAMSGHIWAESAFGEGSTFYVSLPRLTHDEYEKRMIAVRNQQAQEQAKQQQAATNTLASLSTDIPGIPPISSGTSTSKPDKSDSQIFDTLASGGLVAPSTSPSDNPFTAGEVLPDNPFSSKDTTPVSSFDTTEITPDSNTPLIKPEGGAMMPLSEESSSQPSRGFLEQPTEDSSEGTPPMSAADSLFLSPSANSGLAAPADDDSSSSGAMVPADGAASIPATSAVAPTISPSMSIPAPSDPNQLASMTAAESMDLSSAQSVPVTPATTPPVTPATTPPVTPATTPPVTPATASASPAATSDPVTPVAASTPSTISTIPATTPASPTPPTTPATTPASPTPPTTLATTPAHPTTTSILITPVATPKLPAKAPSPADLLASLNAATLTTASASSEATLPVPTSAVPPASHASAPQAPPVSPTETAQSLVTQSLWPSAVASPISQPAESPPISPPPASSASKPPDIVPKQNDINLNGESK